MPNDHLCCVSAFDVPLYDVDKQLTVTEGDHVMLHCPLYASSLPVDITWLYPGYDAVTVDQTKAISDNGTTLLVYFATSNGIFVRLGVRLFTANIS